MRKEDTFDLHELAITLIEEVEDVNNSRYCENLENSSAKIRTDLLELLVVEIMLAECLIFVLKLATLKLCMAWLFTVVAHNGSRV